MDPGRGPAGSEAFEGEELRRLRGALRAHVGAERAREVGGCVACSPLARVDDAWHTDGGKREYARTAMCEACYDNMYQPGTEPRAAGGGGTTGASTGALELWTGAPKATGRLVLPRATARHLRRWLAGDGAGPVPPRRPDARWPATLPRGATPAGGTPAAAAAHGGAGGPARAWEERMHGLNREHRAAGLDGTDPPRASLEWPRCGPTERVARNLLRSPLATEDTMAQLLEDARHVADDEAMPELRWRRGEPPGFGAGARRGDGRTRIERWVVWELALRRPVARAGTITARERFHDPVLRAAFAADAWDRSLRDRETLDPACLACGSPTDGWCGVATGWGGLCGRALCPTCGELFKGTGPCCRRLEWPDAA